MMGLFLNRGFVLFVLTACSLAAVGCGRKEEGQKRDALSVSLQLPEGEQPDLFWYGVEKRSMVLERDQNPVREWIWQDGTGLNIEVDAEDQIRFRGLDRQGRILVEGTALVGKEKKISIPLRRVL